METPALSAIRAALRDLRQRLPTLVGFRVLSWVVSTALLAPLVAWVTGRLIETTGAAAVANVSIASFLLSPAGLLALALASLLVVATSHAEQAGFVRLAAARTGELRATTVLVETLRWLPQLARIGLWQLGLSLLVLVPFLLGVLALWFGLLGEHDVNWYLATRPPRFIAAAALAALLGLACATVLLLLLLRWVFAVPIHVFEGLPARASMRRSAGIVASGRGLVLRRLVSWWALVSLVGAGLGLAWEAFEDRLLSALVGVLREPIVAVALLVGVELAVGVAVAFVAASVHAILRLGLYRELTGEAASAAPADAPTAETVERAPRLAPLLWLGAAGLLLATGMAAKEVIDEMRLEREVWVTAHRGSSARAPENSLAALRAAIEDGADLAEIDVQTTRDGEVVVIHDFDLMRVAGVARAVSEVSLEELRALDAGSWFGPDFAGERVPTLREAIETVRGRIRLLVEIKDNGSDPDLARRVAEVLREEDFEQSCLVMSLELRALQDFRRHAPGIPIGLIVAQSIGDIAREDVDFLAVRAALATADLVASARAAGKQVHAWTVNDPRLASALVDRGVDNLITDEPALVRELLAELETLEPAERLLLGYHNRNLP